MKFLFVLLLYGVTGDMCCAQSVIRFSYDRCGNITRRYVYAKPSEDLGLSFTLTHEHDQLYKLSISGNSGSDWDGGVYVRVYDVLSGVKCFDRFLYFDTYTRELIINLCEIKDGAYYAMNIESRINGVIVNSDNIKFRK